MRSAAASATILAAGLLLTGCAAGAASTQPATQDQPPVAVATTTELGSVVNDITKCAGASSTTLMGAGDDPHTFSVSSEQVAQMARAKVVIANGLGIEESVASTLVNVKRDGGRVFEVAPTVDPIPFEERGVEHEGESAEEHAGEDDAHGSEDPHFWLDVSRMARAATNIGAELTAATGDARYTDCGKQVSEEIAQVDAQVRTTLQAVPAARRTLVTDHDAMGYFADAYDFRVAGVVVPGGSTDAEPSSSDLASIVSVVRRTRVPAIFSNTAVNPQLVEAVAKESGQDVKVVPLYVDSVGPEGSGAETYAGMMTTNARLIADALK